MLIPAERLNGQAFGAKRNLIPTPEEVQNAQGRPVQGTRSRGGITLAPAPPIAPFHTEEDEFLAIDGTCIHQDAPLARGHVEDCCEVHIVDCPIMVIRSDQVPNLPPGLTADGHV